MRKARTVYEWSMMLSKCDYRLGLLSDSWKYYPASRRGRLQRLQEIAFDAIWFISRIDLNDKKFKG